MKAKFDVVFLEEAIKFMSKLDANARKKIYYNLGKAKLENNPELFKKLTDEIWEFRTQYQGIRYRLFAFWDKTDKNDTLVLSTHGIIKKISKVPRSEIEKALKIRAEYFDR